MSIKINRLEEGQETTDTASFASLLDLYLEFDDSGQLSTKIYDFKIINFPNMGSNIQTSLSLCKIIWSSVMLLLPLFTIVSAETEYISTRS
jgi:hypothetical protein